MSRWSLSPFSRRFLLFILPTAAQSAISFLLLPLTTLRLGPADYAIVGIVSSFTGFGNVLASLGSPYIAAHRLGSADTDERARIISTMLQMSTVAGIIFSTGFIALWFIAGSWWPVTREIPVIDAVLAGAAVALSAPWFVAVEVMTVLGIAAPFAIVTIVQSLVSALATLLSIFVFNLGGVSLFVAILAASAVGGIGAIISLRAYIVPSFDIRTAREMASLGLPLLGSNGLDAAVTIIERSILSSVAGLHWFGIYFHSLQYLGFAMTAIKAAFRSIWPISLVEAREEGGRFLETRRVWRTVYGLVSLAGVGFAIVGAPVIGWLTHDKFSEAAPFAAIWMAVLLVQLSGRPQQAVLFAYGKSSAIVMARVWGTALSVVALLTSVPLIGISGGVVSRFSQAATVRVLFEVSARKVRLAPWQDGQALVGIVVILICLGLL